MTLCFFSLSSAFIFSAGGKFSFNSVEHPAHKLYLSLSPFPLTRSPSLFRPRLPALRIQSLVNFGCPHLRLIDSNRLAAAKLSNLTHGRTAACRGVNARETRFQGKHRVGYSLSLPPPGFLLAATPDHIDRTNSIILLFIVDDEYFTRFFIRTSELKLNIHDFNFGFPFFPFFLSVFIVRAKRDSNGIFIHINGYRGHAIKEVHRAENIAFLFNHSGTHLINLLQNFGNTYHVILLY